MPKMRGFKPETWTDEKFVELTPLARLLFMGMWNYACDNGHVEDKPTQLKMRILPADECNVPALLDEMVKVGCVVRSSTHLTVPALPRHQRIDKRYFTSCEHCGPDELPSDSQAPHAGHTAGTRGGHDVATKGSPRDHALKEGSERKGSEGEGESGGAKKRARQLPDSFRPSDAHVALAALTGVDLNREWPKFCDYWKAEGKAKADWDATLRNWIRKAAEFGGNVRALPQQPDAQGRIRLPPLPGNEWSGR